MYEVDVSCNESFKYTVKSLDYEVKVDFPAPGAEREGITPPALLLASVGSCLGVYLERYLRGAKIKFEKFSINVKSDICEESPRYLKEIQVKIKLNGASLDKKRENALLEFVKNCPVHNTLMNKPKVNITI